MNASIPPNRILLLAAVGFGAYWYFTKNRANAGTWPTSAAGQSAAARTPAVQSYLQPTSRVSASAPGPSITEQLGLRAGSRLIDRLFAPSASSGLAPGQIERAAGYEPTYTPDTAGEAEARNYYLNNQDAFIFNPPTAFALNDGVTGGTGGFLDSQ